MVPKDKLKQFPALARLPAGVLSKLADNFAEESHADGAVVFAEGHSGDALYLVASGEVMIRKALERPAGAHKVISLLGPGEFFGEMALLEQTRRSAEAVSRGPSTLFRLPRKEFESLLGGDPQVALEFFRGLVVTLSARLRQTTREMTALFEVGRIIAEGGDAKTLAARILFQIAHSFEDTAAGAFWRWNEFSEEYEFLAAEGGWPSELRGNRQPADPLVRRLASAKECFLASEWAKNPSIAEEERAGWPAFGSLLAAPILGAKGLAGILVFGQAAPGFFTSSHRQVISGVAHLASTAVVNASLREEAELKERLHKAKQYRY
ncbi:MAG: cyclic nucleotide-binding domain-containing protein [Elusimicrobiota bacterium]